MSHRVFFRKNQLIGSEMIHGRIMHEVYLEGKGTCYFLLSTLTFKTTVQMFFIITGVVHS